jgi:tRNA1(Val) A37 N6-methylase TrmN6
MASEEIQILNRRVRLLQPVGGFRTSLDSVMLAAACPAESGQSVLDMGAGVGGAAFCVLSRVPGCNVTGVEIQDEYHALAIRNISLNEAENQAEFVHADIMAFEAERFDHVICNPPFLEAGTYTPAEDAGRAMALGHGAPVVLARSDARGEDLKAWIDAGFRLLKSNGSLTLIHRADCIDKIIQVLGKRFGAVEVIPLWPRCGEPARRVIVRAIKDRRSPALLHPGVVLHEADGAYTPEAERYLRQGEYLA